MNTLAILTLSVAALGGGSEPALAAAVRLDASRTLRAALTDTRGGDASRNARVLARAVRGVSEELGSSRLAGVLDEVALEARWRALADPAAAHAFLVGRVLSLADDLAFTPMIEAELPVGFPGPTPVGEVEVKSYPNYRLARSSSRDGGAFWRLFQHIQRNDIPMTAPVETTYGGSDGRMWEETMAFLYQAPDVGSTGPEGEVEVADIDADLVVSIGCRGDISASILREAEATLAEWVGASGRYEIAGSMRSMGYNSPMVPRSRRYFEVQIPVRTVRPLLDGSDI